MDSLFIVPYYARWHYSRGMRDLFHNIRSFIVFLAGFFSLGILLRTLFSPWERMDEQYDKGFRPGKIAETFLVNFILRLVGFFVRLSVLVFGFLSIVLAMLLGVFLVIGWMLFPLILLFLVALGIKNFLLV